MKITIITINYNNSKGLERTLKSISEQVNRNFEYIVIDGGSTDGSVELIKSYERYISFWLSEVDGGIYNAMNKGVAHASGDYCLFMNSGDHLFSYNTIDRILSQEFYEDIVSFDMVVDNDPVHRYWHTEEIVTAKHMINYGLPHLSTLIKTSMLMRYPYDESYKIVSDWSFFFDSIIIRKCSYKAIHIPVATFYSDGISSKNFELSCFERYDHLKKYIAEPILQELFTKGKIFAHRKTFLNFLRDKLKFVRDIIEYNKMKNNL